MLPQQLVELVEARRVLGAVLAAQVVEVIGLLPVAVLLATLEMAVLPEIHLLAVPLWLVLMVLAVGAVVGALLILPEQGVAAA
jgi:hypothetical protein